MDPHKALLSFCQIDALFSLILFIVENLVVNRQFLVHCLILISSSAGVALSLMEVYVIHQKYYWPLLGASITRLGPMIALSTLWIIHSNRYKTFPSTNQIAVVCVFIFKDSTPIIFNVHFFLPLYLHFQSPTDAAGRSLVGISSAQRCQSFGL